MAPQGRSWAKTIAVGVALSLTVTAGVMAWKTFAPEYFPGEQETAGEMAAAESEETSDATTAEGDELPARLASRSAGDDESAESVVDDLFDEDAPPVRQASAEVPARIPARISPRQAPAVTEEVGTPDEFANLADGDDLGDEAAPPNQGEPEDVDTDLIEEPVRPLARSRSTLDLDTPVGSDLEEDTSPPLAAGRGPSFAVPEDPIEEETDSHSTLSTADAEEPPALRFGRGADVSEEDESAPVELAVPQRGSGQEAQATLAGGASEVLAPEDDLEGYVEVDPRESRALARTQVRRPTEAELAEQARDLEAVDPAIKVRPGRAAGGDPDRVAITPRGRQPQANAAAAPRGVAGGQRGAVGPTSAHYRVEPQDTYWSISRKVYGTPRFFQALAEHNRERVSHAEQLRPGVELETPPPEELQSLYAKFIPAAARGSEAAEMAAADPKPQSRVGIASGSPTRRVGGREVGGRDAPEHDVAVREGTGGASPPDASEFHGPDGGFFVGRGGEPLYRVGNGDTLSSIAQQHLGKSSRSHELYELNQDRLADPNRLKVGSVLKLPPDASRVGVVPRGNRVR